MTQDIAFLLMGGVFAFSGADHFRRFAEVRGMLAARGWPAPGPLLAAASALELVAGLGLAFGVARPVAALALAGFTAAASLLLLDFWRLREPERGQARSAFVINLAVVGGLLLAFAVSR